MSRSDYGRSYYDKNKDKIRAQKRENMRRYRAQNPDHHRMVSRRAKRKLKDQVFSLYGTECVLCGFGDRRALTLDHINHNGADERRRLGERGVYRRAVEKYRPDEYRILCMNCQFIARTEANRSNQHGSNSVETESRQRLLFAN